MFNIFMLEDWYGNIRFISAKDLHKNVLSNNDFPYRWITTTTEILRVCCKKSFPKDLAKDIVINILNCYATLLINHDYIFKDGIDIYNLNTVFSLYNVLSSSDDELIIETRKNFLMSFLLSKTWEALKSKDISIFDIDLLYKNDEFIKEKEIWLDDKFNELFELDNIDFNDELFIMEIQNSFLNIAKNYIQIYSLSKEELANIDKVKLH